MRVLITGASGFAGRHVLAAVAAAGHEPVGLGMLSDELSDDSRPGSLYVGLLDTGIDAELWQELAKHLTNEAGTIRPFLAGKSTPFLQDTPCRSPL